MSRSLPVWLVVAAALAATIAWEMQGAGEPNLDGKPGRSPVTDVARDAPGLAVGDVAQDWLTTALERPLFREDRRPVKTADGAAVKADETRLTGVMTGPFGKRAIFVSAQNAKPIVVGEGARVGNLMVRSIEPGGAVVESDGDVRLLRPSFVEGRSPVP